MAANPRKRKNKFGEPPQPKKQKVETLSSDSDDEITYCVCDKPDDGTIMIQCHSCRDWYHPRCVGLDQKKIEKEGIEEDYSCPSCSKNGNGKKLAGMIKRKDSTESLYDPEDEGDQEVEGDDANAANDFVVDLDPIKIEMNILPSVESPTESPIVLPMKKERKLKKERKTKKPRRKRKNRGLPNLKPPPMKRIPTGELKPGMFTI